MKKRLYLNKKGKIMLGAIFILAILFATSDSVNMITFFITKIIALALLSICIILNKYVKE